MVIGLESAAALSLGDDDSGVEHLVELGQVEPPSPEGKAFVPDPSHIRLIGSALGIQVHKGVLAHPPFLIVAVEHSVAESARSIHLAEGIHGADKGVALRVVREGGFQSAEHGVTGDGRVDGQKDVVENDKGLERARLADRPGLVAMVAVVLVQEQNARCVDGGDGEGDLV